MLDAVPDHVAVAVPDWDVAEARWRDHLGGRVSSWYVNPVFRSRQYRYANGAKVELITLPDGGAGRDNFVRRFLDRHGAQLHHLTLKVPDLDAAITTVRAGGLEVVDVDTSRRDWHEGFLRPAQVGGFVVQLGWSPHGDDEWAQRHGFVPEPTPLDAAALLGPRLRHPDLGRAREIWRLLGAVFFEEDGQLVARWRSGPAYAPLAVVLEEGAPAGPVGLRFSGRSDAPADPDLGPPIEGVEVDA